MTSITGANPAPDWAAGGEVTIFYEERTLRGTWSVDGDMLSLTAAGETRQSGLGALARHPEALARLLLVQIARERPRPRLVAR